MRPEQSDEQPRSDFEEGGDAGPLDADGGDGSENSDTEEAADGANGDSESIETPTFSVGGVVTGLRLPGLKLVINAKEELVITGDGPFRFEEPLASGSVYRVEVLDVPSGHVCSVNSGSQGVVAEHDITEVAVTCNYARVRPLYPLAGANWNDYVRNDGRSRLNASDTPCLGAADTACNGASGERCARGYGECLHGGELRRLELTGVASCVDLVLTEQLQAFDWVCDDHSGTVAFISVALRDGKRLYDLILGGTVPRWQPNELIVRRGASVVARTDPSASFWGNQLELASGPSLSEEGRIYLLNGASSNLSISADKVAIVFGDGAEITNTADRGIDVSGRHYVWVEGASIAATGFERGLFLHGSHFVVVRSVRVRNATRFCVDVSTGVTHSRFDDLELSQCGGDAALYLYEGASYNSFSRVTIARATGFGIKLVASAADAGSHNLFSHIVASNCTMGGIFEGEGWTNNRFVDVIVANNGAFGMSLTGSKSTVVVGLTAVNNRVTGVEIVNGTTHTLTNVVAANDGDGTAGESSGLRLADASRSTLHNLAVLHNAQRGIYFSLATTQNAFTGWLKIGFNVADCVDAATGPFPGLLADCSPPPLWSSDAQLVPATSASLAFVGKAQTDSENAAGGAGGTAAGATLGIAANAWSYLTFQNRWRAWGIDGGPFPSTSALGYCNSTTTCRIYDWSLRSTDLALRTVNAIPSGDDTLIHLWQAADESSCQDRLSGEYGPACSLPGFRERASCEAAGGDYATPKCYSEILRNALEVQGDLLGDDDLLCEADEPCVFLPNLGAYQGDGALAPAGAFIDGRLTGISLLQYTHNGF